MRLNIVGRQVLTVNFNGWGVTRPSSEYWDIVEIEGQMAYVPYIACRKDKDSDPYKILSFTSAQEVVFL